MRVMGTDAVVLVVEPTAAEVATVVALGAIEEIEAACSRFRPDSDLMRVNEAAGRAVPVGRCFIEALDVALDAARRTDGVVDPTIGGALRALGYDRDFASLERDGRRWSTSPGSRVGERSRSTRDAGPSGFRPARASTSARPPRRSPRIEPPAAAAAAIDGPALVSIGGDLAVAGGCPEGGWLVRVTDWQGSALGRAGSDRSDRGRWAGDLLGDRAALDAWRCGTAPPRRPEDRSIGRGGVADGVRRRGQLRRRQRRIDRRGHQGARRRRLADGHRSAGAPHPRRRNGRGRRGMGVRGGMNVLWYVTRGSGITSLLLLTGSVLLGVVTSMNLTAPGLPRFVSGAMHRNVSLLALAFLGVHIATTVVDGYVAIGWVDAVVPFVSSYHPLALGLGTIAVRPDPGADRHQPPAFPDRPGDLAIRAHERLRLLADRPAPRVAHRHRPGGGLDAARQRRQRLLGARGGPGAGGSPPRPSRWATGRHPMSVLEFPCLVSSGGRVDLDAHRATTHAGGVPRTGPTDVGRG